MIIFRPLSLEDMEQIRLWRNEALETLRTPFMLTAEQQQDYYRTVICDRHSTTRYWGFWNEVTKETDNHCSLRQIDTEKEIEENARELINVWIAERGKIKLIGYGGLENIQWENRLAEISILIAPEYRGKGYGAEAVAGILGRGFGQLNLYGIWGECYTCSNAVRFWERQIAKHGGSSCTLPGHRKYWGGAYWPSLYFYFQREECIYA